MPVFGTGLKRTDGRTNPQINTTIRYLSSPNMISNLSFWFDANDNTTIQLQQGNTSNVTGWTSKGNFPIQISTIAQVAPLVPNNAVLPYTVPNSLNGKQTIFMNGVSSMLQFVSSVNNTTVATNNETTVFTVANPTNAVSNAVLFAYDFSFINRIVGQINFAGAGTSFFYGNGTPTGLVGGSGGTYYGLGYYQNTFYSRNSDTSIAIKFRGAPLASATNSATMNTNSHFAIGGFPGTGNPTSFNNPFPYYNTLPRFFIGNYAEILWYNRGLTDDEIVGVEGYLAKKWGIQNQLKFNHIGVATGPPLLGYRLITYPRLVSNYGLWYDAMDTSTIKDVGGNFPPLLPPNALGVGQWNDKSSNNKHLQNYVTQPSQFNLMSPGTFYPAVFSPGYSNNLYYNLRSPTTISYTGSSISAFFVLSVSPNANDNTFFSLSSTFNGTMPIPNNPTGPNVSTFDFSLNYISNTIGFSRFGGGGAFGLNPRSSNNIITAPFTTNTTTLVSMFINGDSTTLGNVLPSTNLISINGAFVSSSTTYSGRPFNLQYISMFGNYNFPANSVSFFNEVAVFYRTLTTPERTLIESQLINKWKLPSNAPVSFINSLPVTSGLFGWYDAYDQNTVLRNASNNVSMWLDKSGQSNHMSTVLCQFGSNTRSNIYYSSIGVSTNSLSALFFPSTFAIMTTSSLVVNQSFSTFSMISVGNFFKLPNGPTPRNVSLYSTVGAQDNAILGSILDSAGGNVPVNNLNEKFSTFHINTMLVNLGTTTDTGSGILTSNAITYFNGVSNLTTTGLIYSGMIRPSYISLMGSGITNTPAEGDLRNNSGSLAEVLLYNRILNNTELSNVHTYLLNKWNISTLISNVPVTRGLNLWLDAYDPATVIFSTNTNLVQQWRDKSVSTLHFSNALTSGYVRPPTYTTNPTNNLPGLLFSNNNPTNTYVTGIYNCNFNYPVTKEATIFTVAQWSSGNNSYYSPVFCMLSNNEVVFYNANNFIVVGPANGNLVSLFRATQAGYLGNIGNTLDRPTLVTGVFNSSFSTSVILDIPQNHAAVGRNGMIGFTNISSFISTLGDGLTITATNFNVNQAVLGLRAPSGGDATWNHSGYIHEVLLYNRTLSFVERQQVESYLLSKWYI
jgi:hypothetical protein